ncbi:MAG TPA: hypothetical protein VFY25_06935 [Anaerolineales bacterium]|nr:hypothetical protein [Anaerolineales bacterium]
MSSDDNSIGGGIVGLAALIYFGIGLISVAGILVWPIVVSVATYVVVHKVAIAVPVLRAIIKAKLNGESTQDMITAGLKAGGKKVAVGKVVEFIQGLFG